MKDPTNMPLEQKIDATFRKKFLRHQKIGNFLYRQKKIARIFNRVLSTVLSFNNDRLRRESLEKFVAVREAGDPNEHGYTDRYGDLHAGLGYAIEISSPDFGENSPGESYRLYQEQLKTLRAVIGQKKPKKVFNFGVCFAYVDNMLAKEFPETEFIGIDLSPHNKAFNDAEFPDRENLTILTGDVFAHFDESDYADSIFFHSRTFLLLPRSFIEKLYKSVFEAGFGSIVGFEQNGLSEETGVPYVFDNTDRSSVYWRNRMYIHNYPYLAEAAGFHVKAMDLFTTNHSSPDFHILRVVAER